MRAPTTLAVIALLAAALAPPRLVAEEPEVPVPAHLQAALFVKILGFDRRLERPPERPVLIGVLRQRGYRSSFDAAQEIADAIAALPPGEPRLETVILDIEKGTLEEALDAQPLAAIYVAPLRALEVEVVAEAARRRGLGTLTGVPDYVGRGVSTGIGLRNGRPTILIDREAARAEGTDYSSRLLSLAEVVR